MESVVDFQAVAVGWAEAAEGWVAVVLVEASAAAA